MISETVYTIEILLERRRGARPGVVHVIAIDRNRQRIFEGGVADLGLSGKAVALPSGRPLLAEEFLGRFRRGAPASTEHGVAFGRMLLGFLFGDSRLARAWNEMQSRRMASGLPMRLLLRLPRESTATAGSAPSSSESGAESPKSMVDVAAIPFELLADEHGFLFKDRGHTLVRVIDPAPSSGERSEDPAETRRAGAAGPSLVVGARSTMGAPLGWPSYAPMPPARAATYSPEMGSPPRELAWVSPVIQTAMSPPPVSLKETVRAWSLEGSAAIGALMGERGAAPLPEPSPFFRGRAALVQSILTLLASERLVSIVGMPGIGKTDLAAAVAHRALYDGDLGLESASWFSLEGLTEVDALRVRIALALGLDPRRCQSDEQLAKGIGNGRALFVLDGAEALAGDALTRTRLQWLLNTLLTERPELRILLVTRRRIGAMAASAGEVVVATEALAPVEPLSASADREMFTAAAGARLLPEEHRSPELTELLAALMGHPRALTLAAAMAGSGASLTELRDQIMQVAAGEPEVDKNAAWAPLKAEEGTEDSVRAGRYVRCLSLVVGVLKKADPRSLEVMAWVGQMPSGLPEVLFPHVFGPGAERLGALLLAEGAAERRDVDRCIRLAAPLACFGVLPSSVIPERRHTELLEATLHAVGAWLSTSGGQPGISGAGADRDRAVQQESNLAALVHAIPEVAPRDRAEALAKAVASAIVPFAHQMIRAGRPRAAAVVCREAVRRIVPLGIGRPLASVLTALGELLVRGARLVEAEQVYEQALPLYRALKDSAGQASTLQALGDIALRAGRLAEAEEAFELALPLFRGLEDRMGEASAQGALGDLYLRTARLSAAEDAYERALPIYRALGERLGEARTLQSLGDVWIRTGRLKEAEDAYTKALPIYRILDEALGEASTLESMSKLALAEALAGAGTQKDDGGSARTSRATPPNPPEEASEAPPAAPKA